MRKIIVSIALVGLLGLFALTTGISTAGTMSDEDAIRTASLDYIDGFYSGDAVRMERALHPELAKRIVKTGPDGHSVLQNMSAEQLIGITRSHAAKPTPPEERRMDVQILDIYENVASVRITAGDWIDYLHLGRVDGEWKIINVLWELTP